MASRGTGFLSALGFAIVGVAAAWLWLVIRPNEHSTDTASPASLAAPPAIVAPRETAPAEPSAPATTDAPRTARAPSLPTHPVGWEDSLRASTDYFALAQRAALSALAGDSRAQYVLGQVLSECRDQLRPVASMQSGSAAGNVRAYLALIPDAENRALVARRIGRCEKFFDGSPLDGLDVPEGAHDSRYWLDQAIASRDPLAVMDHALEESASRHWDSVPPEHRAHLLDDVRIAVTSREPAALFKISTVYSLATVARDPAQGAVWLVAACEAGYDCSNANPDIGQGCIERRGCDARSTLPEAMRLALGDTQFAEIRTTAQEILARINRGDWEGLQPYLEMR
ncbi:MAG TPA: hypothetical protein VE907_20575 [Gammaproteobacteria bacterium]|nr:hypothetical protein [Gammaproteobacteria bacterium]